MQQISGKTALITGGSKGIGLGIADQLVRKGVNVVITGRHEESLAQAAQQLNDTGPGKAIAVVADVRDLAAQRRSVEKAVEAFGRLDVMVANAGVGHFGSILDLTPEQWHETIDINLTGVFNSIKAAAEALIESKGYFITIASLAGTNFFAGGSAYNASKFGVVGFTQAVMLDLRQAGVKCSVIMPGSVATYFNNHQPSVADAWKIQPEDIGQIVVDLLEMHPRTLPSKIEVRPSQPPAKG
ncbi:MAG: short-chain dehydrogenase [Saprospiraceae bacterium]|nr:MAG: short-chain dehydrogenase [Saprospiraceae bacterium]